MVRDFTFGALLIMKGKFLNALLQNDVIKLQRRSSLLKQCVNTAHQRLSQRISYHPMAPLFVKLELLTSNFVEAGQITGVKTHTYRFDGGSEQCSYLKQQPCSRDLSVTTVKYTTTSIMKDIFKTDRLTNKNAVLLSLSGSKSALHRFV